MKDPESQLESNENNQPSTEARIPVKKGFSGKIFGIAGILILLLAAILIFIQTQLFNDLILGKVLDIVNEDFAKKDARIYVSSLTGNILTGISLNDASVMVKGDTLLKMNSLKLSYDLMGLVSKEIIAEEVILDNPQINLTRVKDQQDSLLWNIEYLLKSDKEEEEDTTTTEFDWGISAKKVQIINGNFRILRDKNSDLPIREIKVPRIDTIGLRALDITDFNLDLTADYFPKRKNATINNISFRTNSDFNVDSLRLEAAIDVPDEIATVRNLRLLTDRSDIYINFVRMTEFSLEKGIVYEEFDNNDTQVDLDIKKLNTKDLTFFLPELNFLDSTVSLKLFAGGDYADLNISSLELKLPNSDLTFSGRVKNLDEPSKLYFDVTGTLLLLDPADTRRVIPGLAVPDYGYVGVVEIPYARYKGYPDNFEADIDFRSSVGNIRGSGKLDISGETSIYDGEFEASRVNLGKFLKDKELESDITGEFKTKGQGFDYRTMSGFLDYRMRNSRFYGQEIRRSEGRLDFNKGNVKLGIDYASSTLNAKVAGTVNISNLDNISYNLKGKARGLDISSFTKDNSQKSDLNFDFDVNGRGFEPDKLTGVYKINLENSSYAGMQLPAGAIDLNTVSGGNKDLVVKTEFVDIETKGSFAFARIASDLSVNIDNILAALTDSEAADSIELKPISVGNVNCNNYELDFNIKIKDPRTFGYYVDSLDLRAKGHFSGKMSDSCGIFSLNAEGQLNSLVYSDSTVASDTVPINIFISNNPLLPGLNGFRADLNVSSPRIMIAGVRADSMNLGARIVDGKDSIFVSTIFDSTNYLLSSLSIRDSLIAEIDTLLVKVGKVSITNSRDLEVQYVSSDSVQGINFRNFALSSLGQRLSVNGFYSFNDSSYLQVSGKNLKVETYSYLIGNTYIDSANTLLGNIRNLEIDYYGNLKRPAFNIIAISDVLRYGSTRIGRLDASLKYLEDNTNTDITFTNVNNTGSFAIKGNLPMILTFDSDSLELAERRKEFSDLDVNLYAVARNFQIKVFQQLLPYTRGLEGTIDGMISVLGKAEEPKLTGKMNVDSGKVQVTLTKMRYAFNANLETDDAKIIIKDSRLTAPGDENRFISASGYVDLTGLRLSDLRLDMTGDIKAFDKEYGQTELGISGDLWVGSGKPGLALRGSEGRFDLTGNLLLVKGNIIFNPFIQEVYKIYDDDFRYGVIVDSANTGDSLVKRVILESTDTALVLTDKVMNPFQKILYIAYEKPEVKKVAREKSGAFVYNVYVTTSENVFLKFIVNERSQQEFFGEIKTDLYVDNAENGKIAARGTVTLGNNCYYRFFRKFDATGKTIFNGPVTNPELNIEATYKGTVNQSSDMGRGILDDVIITLDVTGPAMNPKIDISLERNRTKETGQNAASDAISYLLFGKFQDQLTFSESSTLGVNIGTSYLSGILSTELEKVLPFLINTDVSYVDSKSGTLAENADIRFTAAVGDAIVRFGGQLFKGISNTDFIVDYPLGKLLNSATLSQNLYVRLERIYDPVNASANSTSALTGTRTGALIFYRIKF